MRGVKSGEMKLINSVRGHLALSGLGALIFLLSIPLANWTGLPFVAIAGLGVLIASGWLVILHAIGLLLSVGHRLSIMRRAALYYSLAAGAALAVTLGTRTPLAIAGPPIAVALVLVSLLVYADFRRFPPAAASGRYSPFDEAIARFINRCLGKKT